MSDGPENLDTEPMMPGRRPVDRPTPMPKEGQVFAERYTIDHQLGRGGMGVVYKAQQSRLDRPVAIKILKPPERIEDDPKFDERFMREAAAAAKLHHANTITVHDFGQTPEGQLFIVMEFLKGRDLRSVIRASGPFLPARAIHVAAQICRSLREAHGMGMVHRDLKPANVVLVERDGDPDFVKVLDFGLVKYRDEDSDLTLAGKFVGSPKYTSPEALDRHKKVDHRSDIYSLGILIYTMLAGQAPFSGDPVQILTAHLREQPPPISAVNPLFRPSPRLEQVISRCLEKDPEARFPSMDALLEALLGAGPGSTEGELTQTLTRSSDLPASGKRARGRLRMGEVIGVAALIIVTGLALLLFGPTSLDSSTGAGEEVSPLESTGASPESPRIDEPALGNEEASQRAEEGLEDSDEPEVGAGESERSGGSTEPQSNRDVAPPVRKSSEPKAKPEKRSTPNKEDEVPEGYKSNPY